MLQNFEAILWAEKVNSLACGEVFAFRNIAERMKEKILLFILILFSTLSLGYSSEVKNCDQVLHYVKECLPLCGTLKETSKGFVYVDVSDDYIHKLLPFIQSEGFESPPYFGPGLVGAHITFMSCEETAKYHLDYLEECEERIHFDPEGCEILHPPSWDEIDEVYIITVKAPRLNQIRGKYGLPKIHFEYHITIGTKRSQVKAA